jgi:8-oxo-dGTP diphosphatase
VPIKYCAQCGTELTTGFQSGRQRPTCPGCGFVVYSNPIPVAVMVAHRDGEFVLIRRREEPLRGFWAPPSGYVEWDESTEQAALREAREETGLEVSLDRLLGVYSRADTGILFVAYWGEVVGGEARAGEDAEAIAFFAPTRLPPQPATHRGTRLDEWFLEVVGDVMREGARCLS